MRWHVEPSEVEVHSDLHFSFFKLHVFSLFGAAILSFLSGQPAFFKDY